MKKHIALMTGFVSAVLIFCLYGCEYPGDETTFYKMKIDPVKTHTIDTLELEQYRSPQQPELTSVLELPAQPPEKIELALDQCRALALENNLDLKVQLLAPAIAQESVIAERAKFEASFNSNLGLNKSDRPLASYANLEGSQGDSIGVNTGVEIPLQSGTTIKFKLADSRSKTNSIDPTFNPLYGENFSLSISQPLLRNAGIRTNTHSIRIAEYRKGISDAQTKLEVIKVIAAMDRVYWRLYAANKQRDVTRQRYELAQAQLDRAKRFVEAGQHAQIEISRAEAGMAQSLESIITAENELRDRQRELKEVLNKTGLEPKGTTFISPLTEPNPIHYTFNANQLIQQAIENRTEMLELELQIASDISEIYYSRNQLLPVASLEYTYNINGLGATRWDSYDMLLNNKYSDHTLGLNLTIPLGNEFAKSQLRKAYLNRMKTLASKKQWEKTIEVDVLKALDQLEANWLRVLAARQSTLLNEELYQAEIRQFENGMNTSTEVLEAQANFTDAQTSEIKALTEYQISFVDLAFATGTLLGSAEVEWEPTTLPAK